MIEHEHRQQTQERRQRALRHGALAGGLAVALCLLALGVVSWGWLPTIAVAYAVPTVIFVAIFMSESRDARRDAKHETAQDQ